MHVQRMYIHEEKSDVKPQVNSRLRSNVRLWLRQKRKRDRADSQRQEDDVDFLL